MLARPSAPLAACVQKITGNVPWGIEKLTSDYSSTDIVLPILKNLAKIGPVYFLEIIGRIGIVIKTNNKIRNRSIYPAVLLSEAAWAKVVSK